MPRRIASMTDPPIARSANFRRQLGRFERQLGRMGIEFEWIEPTGVDGAIIDALFESCTGDGAKRWTHQHARCHRSLLLLLETATPAHGPAAAVADRAAHRRRDRRVPLEGDVQCVSVGMGSVLCGEAVSEASSFIKRSEWHPRVACRRSTSCGATSPTSTGSAR
jgi:hypothetical protein